MTAFDWDGRLVSYPAERARAYRASGEWSQIPTGGRLHAAAADHADRIALITADVTLTYAELDRRTDQIAAGFARAGLRPGDPVIFQVTNRASTVLAWYGSIKAGLVPVATLAQHRMHEIGHISRKVGAVAHIVEAGLPFDLIQFGTEVAHEHPTMRRLFTVQGSADSPTTRIDDLGVDIDAELARAFVESVEAQTDPEDVAVFQLSGGTTGVPKVIPRIHAEYWNNGLHYATALGWTPDSRVAHMIPVIHNAGISCALHATHAVGATLVLAQPDPGPAFELMAANAVTDVLIGHGHYQAVQGAAFDAVLPTVRRIVLSGAKVPTALFDRANSCGWAGQMFGMSEGMFLVTPLDAPAELRAHAVGVPIGASDEVRILAPGSEQEVPVGAVGELCCRGAYTIPGYFDAVEHNETAFTSDGFYRTGDLASIQVDGDRRYVSIEGRIKDLINRGGEKVNAEEIELLLMRHHDVAVASVVAMPDERLGEKACAYLVSATGTTLTMPEVRRHLDALGVAKFKWPERLVWVSELPTTNVGKIDKKRLRADVVAALRAESIAEGVDS